MGDYFGEMSLMTGEPRSATVTAEAETRVLEVNRPAFRAILEEQPDLVERLGEDLQRRLIEREEAVEGAEKSRQDQNPADLLSAMREFFGL
jgi:CRP-like cAMP-binding protein